MIEIPITYTDFNDEERTEVFHFHLSQTAIAEIAMMVMGMNVGPEVDVEEVLKAIVTRGNPTEIIETFQGIIRKSVGEKSEDGRRFDQSPAVVNGFMQSNAYQELFMRLMTEDSFRDEFLIGMLPSKLAEKAVQARNEPKQYSRAELLRMDDAQFRRVVGEDKDMSREHLLVAMERKNRV